MVVKGLAESTISPLPLGENRMWKLKIGINVLHDEHGLLQVAYPLVSAGLFVVSAVLSAIKAGTVTL